MLVTDNYSNNYYYEFILLILLLIFIITNPVPPKWRRIRNTIVKLTEQLP